MRWRTTPIKSLTASWAWLPWSLVTMNTTQSTAGNVSARASTMTKTMARPRACVRPRILHAHVGTTVEIGAHRQDGGMKSTIVNQNQNAVKIITQDPEEIGNQRKSISITQDRGAGMTMIITQPEEMMIKIVIQGRDVMLMVEIVTLAQDDAMKMMKIGTLARDDAMEMMKIVTLAQDGVMMMMEIVTLTQDGVMMKMKIVTLNQDGITTKIKALSQLDALSSIETPRTSSLRLKKPGCRQKRRKATARRGAEPLRLRIRRRALPAPLQALQARRPRLLLHQAKKEIGAGSVIGAAGRGAIHLLQITEEDEGKRRKRKSSRKRPKSRKTINASRCFQAWRTYRKTAPSSFIINLKGESWAETRLRKGSETC